LTVTDNLSGLIWEKKTDDGSDHDWDDLRTWGSSSDGDSTNADGTAFTQFLVNLNNAGFAGADDWRLPTLAELQTLVSGPYPCSPCIDPIVGLTQAGFYWTATPLASDPGYAWAVSFVVGSANFNNATALYYARAVRGGL